MTAESMTYEDLLRAYSEQEKELERLRSTKKRYEAQVKVLSESLEASERRVDSLIAKVPNNKPRAVEDFKLINMSFRYYPLGSTDCESADKYISRLAGSGFEPYGEPKETDKGIIQPMIKYKEEA